MISEARIEEAVSRMFSTLTFESEPAGLYDPLRYMIQIGGKRIRPRLCLTAYALFKDSFDESILSPAAALEVFHSFTLIHDDIMDKADIRRGVPTVYRRWNENTAILSGDVMSIDSYKRMAKAPTKVLPQALELFSTTAAQVCEGQQYDMDFESMEQVPMDGYIRMITLKTAVLMACSAKMGALIAGADESICNSLYDFGINLGIAFQIADDWLDTFGDVTVFGKKIGGDILNDKKTWLLTKAMEVADDSLRAALREAMALPAGSDGEKAAKIAAVSDIYRSLGIGALAQEEIVRYHVKALDAITGVGLGGMQVEMLKRYAAGLLGRQY
ncbi:MAG: polyprenyl synthetase family protein [Bacteroidales bacterium]|nr:polyprenyl synthetase family protein [Bacteroidales bacterium]